MFEKQHWVGYQYKFPKHQILSDEQDQDLQTPCIHYSKSQYLLPLGVIAFDKAFRFFFFSCFLLWS